MTFQSPIHLSVAAILVLTLLGAGVILAQSGVQQIPRIAAPAPSPCVADGASLNTALPATTTCGSCDATSAVPVPAVSRAAAETGRCGEGSAYPAANTGHGTAAPARSSSPAVFEDSSNPAPNSGACCGTRLATNGSPTVIAASP